MHGGVAMRREGGEKFDRTADGAASVERNKEYVEAALSTPLPAHTVVFRHILPNCLPPLIVVATVQIANAIALEATLSFLGLGLPPTEPSLGMLIANGFQYMLSGRYWISIYPGIALIGLIDPPGRIVSGSVKLAGQELVGLAPRKLRALRGARMAMVFQDPMSVLNP